MRIAWITYDFEEYSVLQVNALAREHDVLLVIPRDQDGRVPYEVDARAEVFAFENPRLRQPLRQWKTVRAIRQQLRRFDPDVIHLQQGHLFFNTVLRRLEAPLVMTIHDPRHHEGDVWSRRTPQWWMDYGFRAADHVIVHGRKLALDVQQLFGFRRDQTHVIPHVAMGDASVNRDVDQEPYTVLFFGRNFAYKGLETLIRAESMVASAIPEVRFVIAGDGDDPWQHRPQMECPERYEIHHRWVSDEERAHFFQRSALVVLPYREATQSGVIPVAYNHARPVVATSVGALAECVEDGRTGRLVPPQDPAALAKAIVELLSDPETRQAMGREAYQYLQQRMSPIAVARQTAEVYKRAIGRPADPPTDRSRPVRQTTAAVPTPVSVSTSRGEGG